MTQTYSKLGTEVLKCKLPKPGQKKNNYQSSQAFDEHMEMTDYALGIVHLFHQFSKTFKGQLCLLCNILKSVAKHV